MKNIFVWIFLRILPAAIMLQTLYFKFSGAPESIYIFSTIGMEPWGRYAVGIGELIAGVLLLVPKLSWIGALLGVGLMSGAIFFHMAFLGIQVQNDGGQLFAMALVVFIACFAHLVMERQRIFSLLKLFKK
mgnify:CR=1 FL=1